MKTLRTLPRRAAGFSIVTAVFLVVVLSALAVAAMSLSRSQQSSSALDLLGARAYEAARAGVEYGLYQQQINGSCVASRSFVPGGTLSAFTVTVQCAVVPTPGMGASMNRITVTAVACNVPAAGVCPNAVTTSADYVQRTVTVQF
ncbi:agglutinin biogenesis protein MshP [Rugamonas rivuli]|uniref:Agglutinin biogenesis protein MshP n=1 Tax=Rugamonas rivuli TaxID=2743358 RepID=A0A843SEK0_9BURK|nr:agglutinin biogenesis protein MshP [Rugamonas rivuli]MQA18886.1 agglutinin biogenesis protein MshP [Rugamonas rivuli]